MTSSPQFSWWARFWHLPVRAERLALMRILLALALLTDQLLQLLPNFAEFYGPGGVAFEGLHDRHQLSRWRWTILFFNTDHLPTLYIWFTVYVAATFLLLIGWQSRLMNALVWFLTLCFINRNPNILNGGDGVLQVGLLLLLLGPSGQALSVDAWLRRRAGKPLPATMPAWPVRLVQIQLCMIYLSTGLVKVKGEGFIEDNWWMNGTWWDGTSVYYVLNYVTMSRWSYAQFPVPFWITVLMTYVSVWWEVLFTPMVLFRRTRAIALIFGILFHLGIFFTIEVGWFGWYTMSLYGVWVSDAFWIRREQKALATPPPPALVEPARATAGIG